MSRDAEVFTTPSRPWVRPVALAIAVLAAAGAVTSMAGVFSAGRSWWAGLLLFALALVLIVATVLGIVGAVGASGAPVSLGVDKRGLRLDRDGQTFLRCTWADLAEVRVESSRGRPALVLVPKGSWDAYVERNPDAERFGAIGRSGAMSVDLERSWVGPLEAALRRLRVGAYAGE